MLRAVLNWSVGTAPSESTHACNTAVGCACAPQKNVVHTHIAWVLCACNRLHKQQIAHATHCVSNSLCMHQFRFPFQPKRVSRSGISTCLMMGALSISSMLSYSEIGNSQSSYGRSSILTTVVVMTRCSYPVMISSRSGERITSSHEWR